MNAQAMFRTQSEDCSSFSLKEEQVGQFYKKIIQSRGTLKNIQSSGSIYLGIRLSGNGEEWSIYRELISVTFSEKEKTSLFFIDENREIETWLFEFLKPYLNLADINIITSDLDEVLNYNRISEHHFG